MHLVEQKRYLQYWGKQDEKSWHPAAYHLLDVAAVGRNLLEKDLILRRRFTKCLEVDNLTKIFESFVFLLALHDIGKFSLSFQGLSQTLIPTHLRSYPFKSYDLRHDSLGYFFLDDMKSGRPLLSGVLPWLEPLGNGERRTVLAAFTGHHGQPPILVSGDSSLRRNFPELVKEDIYELLQDLSFLLPVEAELDPSSGILDDTRLCSTISHLSWSLAGWSTLADWIGSSFPFCKPVLSLEQYWIEVALPTAQERIEKTGVVSATVTDSKEITRLFTNIVKPTPLQQQVATMPLGKEQQLFLIEEQTGSGKTEAALMLAHRILAQQGGGSIFFALPTMASSNGIFERLVRSYRNFFDDDASPSVVLAHSSREMNDSFAAILEETQARAEGSAGRGEKDQLSSEEACTAWLGTSTKRALFASVGVGTVDQALLAVLPVRHQSLRLLGLMRGVLIVDEVHSYDPYMNRLLTTLIREQTQLGGSVILLSATVAVQLRKELLNSFAGSSRCVPDSFSSAYPLLSKIDLTGLHQFEVDSVKGREQRVRVTHIDSLSAVYAQILEVAESGSCICWLRNTVDDAIAAAESLKDKLGDKRVLLFHARYSLGDRLAIEREVLSLFGKSSTGNERQGMVVVATQVIEQSLDLDFDVMVTDLAPIDLIIQRVGRLRRHRRDSTGALCDEADGRAGEPQLFLHAPTWDEKVSADWLKGDFRGTGAVYPFHGKLWLTLRYLVSTGYIETPARAREMISAVYDMTAEIPLNLLEAELVAEGATCAAANQGYLNTLKFSDGYLVNNSLWQEEQRVLTRLGEPTTSLRLVVWAGEEFVPYGEQNDFPWEKCEVKVPLRRYRAPDTEHLSAQQQAALKQMQDLTINRYSTIQPMFVSGQGEFLVPVLSNSGETAAWRYSKKIGLQFKEVG